MNKSPGSSRRNFLKKMAVSTAAVATGTTIFANENKAETFQILKRNIFGANDTINIGLMVGEN